MTRNHLFLTAVGALGLIGLAACDNGPSAVRTRDRSAVASGSGDWRGAAAYADSGASSDRAGDSSSGPRDSRQGGGGRSAGQHDTWWASSRKYAAAESAAYHFQRDGADFGASSVDDYVAKAHAFVSHPPHGTLTMERRNGDVLLYDPRANVFAVATRDGAPRTMFKPRDGRAYWDKQKDTLNGRADRGAGGGGSDQAG